jgi:putative ABC transport system permease protein
MRDLSVAFRSLRRMPGFSVTALAAIALGIGSATAVFSVTDHLLFKPLPYLEPDRLVTVGADIRSKGQGNWAVPAPEYDAWRQGIKTLTDLAGYQTFGRFTIVLPEAPVEVEVNRITVNFLNVLGVAPVIGRPFGDADFVVGAPPVLLLTDRAWRRHFAANRDIVGKFLTVNGAPAEVAGILPTTFAFPSASRVQPDVIVPLIRTKESAGSGIVMIGRMADGAAIEAARAEIDALAAFRAAETFMRNARIDGATVEPLGAALSKASRPVLQMLLGAVAVLLLIGCANVANLLLARGADRRGELAIRTALGATRGSLVRLLLIESTLLAVAGGAIGAVVATVVVGVLGPLVPADLQHLGAPAVDGRAFVFAALASFLVVVVAGAGPAFAAAGANLTPGLAGASGRSTGTRWRIRQILVGVEVALAVVLLVAGGLMVSSIVRVLGVEAGYTPDSVLTMRVQLPRGKQFPKRSQEFTERVITAARGVRGVIHVGASESVPLGNSLSAGHYRVEGFPYKWIGQGVPKGDVCCSQTQSVTDGFFLAAGIGLVRGRTFTKADAAGAPPVALIGESLARRFPAGMDPIGHYLTSAEEGSTDTSDRRVIVGIVRDVRDMKLERAALPTFYLPMEERGSAGMTLFLRTSIDPESVAGAVQKAVQQAAGPVIITDVLPFDDVMKRSVGSRHLNAWLFGSFGVLGLLLAAIGIGSVVSYSVARRTREMGVRLALGARPFDVQRLVVQESMKPVLAGLTAGVGAALMLSRLVATLLFEVQPRDVATYVGVCVLLATAAVIAAVLPARRAARVNPLVALRSE